MSFSFSIPSKPKSNASRKPTTAAAFSAATASNSESTTINYVSEFNPAETPSESGIKPIAPIPNVWRPNIKLKNLPNLTNGADSSLQFELDSGSKPEATDSSMVYGLNLRESATGNDAHMRDPNETISQMEIRKLREDLNRMPEDTGMDDYTDVPVEGFGAALLLGYGWKEGQGIGRNTKEDVKVAEVTKKAGRGGLGFTGEFPENRIDGKGNGKVNGGENKVEARKEKKGHVVGKEVRIVNGREMGMKGKIVEVRSSGDLLVVRVSRTNEKVKVRSRDVAELGSLEEDKCLRKLKELKIKEKEVSKDKRDRKNPSKRENWLRNHIRVRIISEKLKGGKLFLKKAVVMDVVGPGICDIAIDETMELVQGVDQGLLETALPKRGGPVLVLYGKHKGVFGSLVERDSEKETGIVRDEDTHELLDVRLEQIAEYTGDVSDIGY